MNHRELSNRRDVRKNIMHETKEPHQMIRSEFIDHWLGKYRTTKTERPISFTEWAKSNGIVIPHVDFGKVFGMAMHNSKTSAQKGKWKAELSRYAEYTILYEKYKKEVAEVEIQVLANKEQLAMVHKRKVRLALRNNKSVSREILRDYPDIKGGFKDDMPKMQQAT
jgi:hypothetical protein